jgi:hypothetical protein
MMGRISNTSEYTIPYESSFFANPEPQTNPKTGQTEVSHLILPNSRVVLFYVLSVSIPSTLLLNELCTNCTDGSPSRGGGSDSCGGMFLGRGTYVQEEFR